LRVADNYIGLIHARLGGGISHSFLQIVKTKKPQLRGFGTSINLLFSLFQLLHRLAASGNQFSKPALDGFSAPYLVLQLTNPAMSPWMALLKLIHGFLNLLVGTSNEELADIRGEEFFRILSNHGFCV
jgi:hypothetical protein